MAYEQRDNSGSLFKNDRKDKPEQPDYTGTIQVAGVDYWLSGWLKGGENGKKKFFSLAVTAKDKQTKRSEPKKQAQATDDFLEDDIPF